MKDFDELISLLRKLPGVSAREARRFAYFFADTSSEYANGFSSLVQSVSGKAKRCEHCFRLMLSENAGSVCSICDSPNRDLSRMMIIEKDADLEQIESTNAYNGRYFVLGGTVPMKEEKMFESVRGSELFKEVKRAIEEDGLSEIILALSFTPEGEFTTEILRRKIEKDFPSLSLSTFGRGLSVGSELEYADKETIKNAFESRK